jgi:hypothetical protein
MLVAWVAFCVAWRDLRVGNTGTYYAALSRIKDTCPRFRLPCGKNRDVAYAVVIELLLATPSISSFTNVPAVFRRQS